MTAQRQSAPGQMPVVVAPSAPSRLAEAAPETAESVASPAHAYQAAIEAAFVQGDPAKYAMGLRYLIIGGGSAVLWTSLIWAAVRFVTR